MSKKLLTIEQHNAKRRAELAKELKTGVECPTCKNAVELLGCDGTVMDGFPPIMPVRCPRCGARTVIIR